MSESVKAPETKAPAKKTQAVTEAKTEAVLYVGPTISGIAITGTVYTTIPEAAKAAKADAPMILNLFIPIREPRYYSEFVTTTKKRTDTEPFWR